MIDFRRTLCKAVTKLIWLRTKVGLKSGTYSKPPYAHIELQAATIGTVVLDAWVRCHGCHYSAFNRLDMVHHIERNHPGHERVIERLKHEIQTTGNPV